MLETMKEKPIQSQNSTTDALPETPRLDIEVPEKPKRRRFTAAYKLRVLELGQLVHRTRGFPVHAGVGPSSGAIRRPS